MRALSTIALALLVLTSCSTDRAASDQFIAAHRLQIALTHDRERPYEIGRLGRKYTSTEILEYLKTHFAQPSVSRQDTILLIPRSKGVDLHSAPILRWAKSEGVTVVSMPPRVNAIDGLLNDQQPGGDIGKPIRPQHSKRD